MTAPVLADRLSRAGVIAVLRAATAASALRTVEALISGGVTGIEITFSTPDADRVIAQCRDRFGDDILLGAGTVLTAVQAEQAASAGAEFLVTPGLDVGVVERMRGLGIPFLLGAFTPTELMAALRLGAEVVKLFPANVGGPAHLRALRGPFPDVPIMPTGGVQVTNLPAWVNAGAIAVGAGSDLCPPQEIAAGNFTHITVLARTYAAAWKHARP